MLGQTAQPAHDLQENLLEALRRLALDRDLDRLRPFPDVIDLLARTLAAEGDDFEILENFGVGNLFLYGLMALLRGGGAARSTEQE